MSSEALLRFDHVSKRYVIRSGRAAIRTLAGRGKPQHKTALDDVSFEIVRGESVAMVGSNGAGKTTALRIASGVTVPTTGRATLNGTVGALIEVGSGLHPDLTGRENIMIYGNMLGMSRDMVRRRFDDIVDFSGLHDALDQQVKFYSSGMHLRLGFSIAAHLEPELLIIDEALSVGDIAFQAKCTAYVKSLVEQGTTLIFVSHHLSVVESLCTRGLLFEQGRLSADADIKSILRQHILDQRESSGPDQTADKNSLAQVTGFEAFTPDRPRESGVIGFQPLTIEFVVELESAQPQPKAVVGLTRGGAEPLVTCSMLDQDGAVAPGFSTSWRIEVTLEQLPLRAGNYEVWCDLFDTTGVVRLTPWMKIGEIAVDGPVGTGVRSATELLVGGPVVLEHTWGVSAQERDD